MPLLCGGLGEVKPADENIHSVVQKVGPELCAKITEKHSSVTASNLSPVAVSYKSQVVAGTNFFIKIKIADADFIHARIYRDLQGNVTVHSVSEIMTETDEIVYF